MTKMSLSKKVVLNLALCGGVLSAQAASPEAREGERVRRVLQVETTTEPATVNRRELLQPSQRPTTESESAWWQSGYVKRDGEWRAVELSTVSTEQTGIQNEYRAQRAAAPKTADGQFALANWCRDHKLPDQERAHLMQTLQLADLQRDVLPIYERMRFKPVGARWVAPAELAEMERDSQAIAKDVLRWRPRVERIARNMAGSAKQQRLAEQELSEIDDPSSIPALVTHLGFRSEPAAMATVEVLTRLSSYRAAQALAYQAVFAPWSAVAERAIDELISRDQDDYVPELMNLLHGPVTTVIQDRLGASYARYTALQEGHDHVRLARFTFVHHIGEYIDYYRPMVPNQSGLYRRTAGGWIRVGENGYTGDTAQRQTAAAVEEFRNRLTDMAEDATAAADKINGRVGAVLSRVSAQPESSDPKVWWNWWANQMDVDNRSSKPVVVLVDEKRPGVESARVKTVFNPSCLVAGTGVWTDRGLVAVEQIAVGDMVLAKDVETGELAYKPVVHTTTRAPVPVRKFVVSGQPIVASGGHNFWVSGDGWTRTRELVPQQPLHTVTGMARIESVADEAEPAAVFNLVVADFHTYFVGPKMVLSHDVLPPRPTDTSVPGLDAKATGDRL